MIGASAVVSGLSNVFPAPYVSLFNAYEQHNVPAMLVEQRRIQELARIIYTVEGNDIAAVKAGLEYLGRGSRRLRVAVLSASDRVVSDVGRILSALIDN